MLSVSFPARASVQCTSLDTVIRWLIAESLLAFVTRVQFYDLGYYGNIKEVKKNN